MNTIEDILAELSAYNKLLFELENHILTWAGGDNVLQWQDEMANKLIAELEEIRFLRNPESLRSVLIDFQSSVIAAMAGDEDSTRQQFARLTHRYHYKQQEQSQEWYLHNGHLFKSKSKAAEFMADHSVVPLTKRVIERHLKGLPSPRDLKPR